MYIAPQFVAKQINQLFQFFLYLQDWELLVLCKLKWDLSAVTSIDFIDVLLHRLSLPSADILKRVRKAALVNLSMTLVGKFHCTETYFILT